MIENFVEDDGTEVNSQIIPEKKELLRREDELLDGLFSAIGEKENHEITKMLSIQRNGKKLFDFEVRALDEQELVKCRRRATKYGENPAGKRYPKIELDTDVSKLRSIKIYMATTEEFKKKLWDNPAVQEKFNVVNGFDVVDLAFTAGEKDAVVDAIDELSGYGVDVDVEEYTKN